VNQTEKTFTLQITWLQTKTSSYGWKRG